MRPLPLLLLLAALGCGVEETPPVPRPLVPALNVIVVSFDALRADALGVYGSEAGASPRIDAWAEGAIVFENAWSTTPVTPTSLASLLAGRSPLAVFRDWRFDAVGSLAPRFAEAGFATGAFLHNPQLVAKRGFAAGFDTFVVKESVDGRLDGAVLARALGWMTSRSGPFLAWVHLLDPHASWDRSPLAESFYDAGYRGRYEQAGPGVAFAEHDPAELARLRSLYTGEVFLADRHFGTLLDALTAAGLLERSVLLLTADHGEGLMDHGLLQHGQVYEEDLRIPLVLGVPGLPAGRRVAAPVTQLDVLPTLAGLAGVALEGPVAGRDLTRVPTAAREVVGVAYTDDARRRASLRDEDGTKLVVDCGGGPGAAPPSRQLFDLSVDPGEREDLAAARPERARALEQRLWQALGVSGCAELRMARSSGRGAHEGLDPETVRRLEALGYGGDAR